MYEDVCYKKTYLAEVIARIDFATPIEALQKNVSTKIMAKITKHFPIAEPVEAIGTHFEFGADGGMKKQETRAKQWNFFGKDRDRQLVLTDTSVFVRYTKYGAFEPFAESFMDAVTEIDREHPGIFSQRFGLRYINRFEFDGLSLGDVYRLFSHETLGTLSFASQVANLTRIFYVAELKFDDVDVRFQYGFPNPDFPAIIKRNIFVMDIDAYVQVTHTLAESLKYMGTAHEHIQTLFESAVTEELRGRMNA